MRLLFDHNLSPRLVNYLQIDFPDASHVALLGLERSSDQEVWQYAKSHNYILVSKDTDFNDFVTFFGYPPKVVWLRVGNRTTSQVLKVLQAQKETLHHFNNDPASGLLFEDKTPDFVADARFWRSSRGISPKVSSKIYPEGVSGPYSRLRRQDVASLALQK